MAIFKWKRQPLQATLLAVLLLALFQGCGDDPTEPASQARVVTKVSLERSVISPGDTIVATVSAVNEGTASASFVFYCDDYLWAAIESSGGICLVECVRVCDIGRSPVPLELLPGEALEQTFRYSCVDAQGEPFPPGLYVVVGGVASPGAIQARAGFVIAGP